MVSRYPFPWKTGTGLLRDAFLQQRRSFRADALRCAALLDPPLSVLHPENVPEAPPCLLVTNHYARPGFDAWWIALAISAVVPHEVHWMMTNAWTHTGHLEPATRWLFPRLARVYGFTPTPPMPPDPRDVDARARSVRGVLEIARSQGGIIGLAPEGRDHPGGILNPPPPGAGRFIYQLTRYCKRIVPIGVYEDGNTLCVNFGPAFELGPMPAHISPQARDSNVSQQVMRAIARQLPLRLRGIFGESKKPYGKLLGEDREIRGV